MKRLAFPEEPEENLLYFIEKHAPLLEPWQRRSCGSCARSPSTFIRSGRPR